MHKLALLIPALLLAGCGPMPQSQQQTANKLDRKFVGRPANEFFYSYGLPSASFTTDDGWREYRWASIDAPYSTGRSSTPAYVSPDGRYQIVDTYNGVTEPQYCELRIYADENDVIGKFAVAADSTGRYTASRCNEIFWTPSLL